MPDWGVPGYAVEDLVGTGATGEVRRARETATGEVVAVKLLRVAGRSDAAERVRAGLDRLAGVRHPHLVRLRAVLPAADGMAVISDFAAGGSLAEVLAERGALEPGEVVTVGVPLASALAALHGQELVHGAVTPANVLLSQDGRPLLSDFGLAVLLDPGSLAGPADDVQALGALLAGVLDTNAPPALRQCVGRALAADPAVRPTAGELTTALRSVGPPAPVRFARATATGDAAAVRVRGSTLGDDPTPERAVSRQAARPPLALLAGVPLALLAAVLAGRAWAAADRPGTPPALQPASAAASHSPESASGPSASAGTPSSPGPQAVSRSPGPAAAGTLAAGSHPPVNWLSVLTTLDDRRNAALASLDATALANVYAAGSAPLATDTASIRRLAAAGARVQGLRLDVRSVQIFRRTPVGTTLRIVDQLPAYQILYADGRVRERRPGRGPLTWLVELVPAGNGWRIATVTRA